MALDPRIILGLRPTPGMGPDFGQAIADGNGLLRLQQQQEQMKQMAEMQAAANAAVGGGPDAGNALNRLAALNPKAAQTIQQYQQQNALRGILGQPGAVDANGQPTDDTMQKVMSVAPDVGMKLKQNALAMQEHNLRLQHMKTDMFAEKMDLINGQYAPILETYEESVRSGAKTPEQAAADAQEALTAANKSISEGGLFSETEQQKMPTKFDPIKLRSIVAGSKEYQAWRANGYRANKEAEKDAREQYSEPKPIQWVENGQPAHGMGVWDKVNHRWVTADSDHKEITGTVTPYKETSPNSPKADENVIAAEVKKEHPDWSDAQVILEAKKRVKTATSGTSISDEAADLVADRVLAGDERATVGMARSAANIAKVTDALVKRANDKGMSGADIARAVAEFSGALAGERSLATRSANMEIFANEVKTMAPLALSASQKVNRTQYPSLNSIIQAAEKGTGNEDVVTFGLAANSLIYTYSKFLNPNGVPTDADKARAAEILSTAWSKGQFAAAVDQMKKEIASGQAAVRTARDEVGNNISPKKNAGKDDGSDEKSSGKNLPAAKTDEGGEEPPRRVTFEEYQKLPPNAKYIGRDGVTYTKGGGSTTPAQAKEGGEKTAPTKADNAKQTGSGKSINDPVVVKTPSEAAALPPNTYFVGPDGKVRQRAANQPSAPTN